MIYTTVMKQMIPTTECTEAAGQDIDCGVAKAIKIIGSKWTMLILHRLCVGTMRFGALQRALPGISPKTLSERLQELEKEGIVTKKVFAEVPLHVEYSLTAKGVSLREVFQKIEDWGNSQ